MVDPLSEPKAGGAVLGTLSARRAERHSPIRLRTGAPFQFHVLSHHPNVAIDCPGVSFMLASSVAKRSNPLNPAFRLTGKTWISHAG